MYLPNLGRRSFFRSTAFFFTVTVSGSRMEVPSGSSRSATSGRGEPGPPFTERVTVLPAGTAKTASEVPPPAGKAPTREILFGGFTLAVSWYRPLKGLPEASFWAKTRMR